MRIKRTSLLLTITLIIFSFLSCQTYTYEDAKIEIKPIPSKVRKAVENVKEPEANIEIKEETKKSFLTASFLPLPSFVIEGDITLIAKRINEENLDIVAFTGENIILEKLKDSLSFEYIELTHNSLLATNLPFKKTQYPYLIFSLPEDKSIAISLIDIRDNSYYYEALSGQRIDSWTLKEDMSEQLNEYLTSLTDTPTLVFASLYHPFDSDILFDYSFIDPFMTSHYINQLEKESTLRIQGLSLRSDYIFSKNLIPLNVEHIPITIVQTRKVPSEVRSAISGTFIVQ